MPDHNDVLEVQLDEHFSEIVGAYLIHIVALPRLVGAAKTAAVMATKLAITFTVGGRRIFHQQVSVLGRVTMRLIWILSREGPCVRLSVVGVLRSQGRLRLPRWRAVRRPEIRRNSAVPLEVPDFNISDHH